MHYSEYINVFKYLVWTSQAMKKVDGILAKPSLKKGETITTETLHLVRNVYEGGKKDYVSVSKGDYKQISGWLKNYSLCLYL